VEEEVGMAEEYMREMGRGNMRDVHEGGIDTSLGEEWEVVEVEQWWWMAIQGSGDKVWEVENLVVRIESTGETRLRQEIEQGWIG